MQRRWCAAPSSSHSQFYSKCFSDTRIRTYTCTCTTRCKRKFPTYIAPANRRCQRATIFQRVEENAFSGVAYAGSLSLSLPFSRPRARQTNAPSRGIVAAHASVPLYPCRYPICVTRTHFLHAHVMHMYMRNIFFRSTCMFCVFKRTCSSINKRVRGRLLRPMFVHILAFASIILDGNFINISLHRLSFRIAEPPYTCFQK